MEENRDIYRKKEAQAPTEADKPIVELTPVELRSKTLRTTIGFSVIMLALLGGTIWLSFFQAEQGKRSEMETNLLSQIEIVKPRGFATMTPAVETQRLETVRKEPAAESPAGSTRINAEKMTTAMGEVRIAKNYLHAQQFDQAEAHVRKALAEWPNMNAAERLLGVIYTQRGQFDQAIAILEHALEADPFSAETLNNLATAYMQKGLIDKAEELLHTSLQLQPNYYTAQLNLGLLHLAAGRYESAIEYFENAIEQQPGNINARNNMAVAMIRLKRLEEARRQLQLLINIQPAMPAAYFNTAITYVMENDVTNAMQWIERGARYCNAVTCQKFIADTDFDPIRTQPEFQNFLRKMFPEIGTP